jgi:hypothetical protein
MREKDSFDGFFNPSAIPEYSWYNSFRSRSSQRKNSHFFSIVPQGYHWSATTQDYYSEMAWIVYFESGTTCYEHIKNRAGYVWPVRGPFK